MLDKYESFYKISKSSECSIYRAFNRHTAQHVLMNRIKTKLAWNQILAHRHIQLMSKSKIFPKMYEILRHKGFFYIVFEKPSGNSLAMTNSIQKLQLQEFYQLISDLLDGLKQIQNIVPNPIILPEWIYYHRNTLKIVHFQTFLDVDQTEKKHVATYGRMNSQNPQFGQDTQIQSDYLPQQYKKNLSLHLGIVAYRLLSGKKQEQITTKEDYESIIAHIRQNCERQILKITGDSKLANFIYKMMSNNQFQVPTFAVICNYFQNQVGQKKKRVHKELTLDIELQKIHIGSGRKNGSKQLKLRKCCINEHQINNHIKKTKIAELNRISMNHLQTIKKSKLFLPYISTNRNLSCLNRHNPILTPQNKQQAKREHIKSFDFHKYQE